jgi:HSP20 family protein
MATNENENSSPPSQDYYLPAVDALETQDELVLIADMPGVGAADLEVTVEEGILTMHGRVAPGTMDALEAVQREFVRGDYQRQFRIPRDFQTDKIEAALKAGVVTVRIPREERSKPRKIPIRVE